MATFLCLPVFRRSAVVGVVPRARRDERGFTMIELLMAMSLLAIIASPLIGVLTASMAAQGLSRERTLAQQAAMTEIESIRALPYASVGLVNGNPAGTLSATTPISKSGLVAQMTIQVTYTNDPARGSLTTYADYKKIVVTITRRTDGHQLTQETTYIAPPGKGAWAGPNQAVVKAQVVDFALNQPVSGATVSLATGPSAPRADVTDSAGSVIFPDLAPNPTTGGQAFYDLSVSATGYQALKDDVSPATAAYTQLTPGRTFTTILRVYKPATIIVTPFTSTGTPYGGSETVTVSSSRGQQSFAGSGTMTITNVAGEQLVPGLQYTVSARDSAGNYTAPVTKMVPDNYPSILTTSFPVSFLASVTVTVTVKKRSWNGTFVVSGATVTIIGGPASVTVSGTTNSSGVVALVIPAGNGYTVTSSDSQGGSAQWTGNLTTSQALTLTE
jgi:prepilin-type N-terminal cleavage/methylation domain-containing protein